MSKKIGLIIPSRNEHDAISSGKGIMPADELERLVEKLIQSGFSDIITELNIDKFYAKNGRIYEGNLCISDLDMVFWFYCLAPGSNSWDLTMLRTLAQTTPVLPNPNTIARGLDKFHSHTLLRNAGIPTADFSLFRSDNAHNILKYLSEWEQVLLKPTNGAFGHGIHRVNSEREFIDAVEYAASFSKEPLEIFCEKFEKNDLKQWISTTIIDGKLIYGYRKNPEKFSSWKVYDASSIGGGIEYVDPAPVEEIALKAAETLCCDIIGFDFIFSEVQSRYLIVDENTLPGMYPICFEKSCYGNWSDNFASLINNYTRQLETPSFLD